MTISETCKMCTLKQMLKRSLVQVHTLLIKGGGQTRSLYSDSTRDTFNFLCMTYQLYFPPKYYVDIPPKFLFVEIKTGGPRLIAHLPSEQPDHGT
jgi:hypothetical protein